MKNADRLLLAGLLAALLLMAVLVLGTGSDAVPAGSEFPGEARDVDLDLLRRRIIRGELSDREALYWHRERGR